MIPETIVNLTRTWTRKTDIPLKRFVDWLAVSKSKFHSWINRYGKANGHNAPIPRDFWLEESEQQTIIALLSQ